MNISTAALVLAAVSACSCGGNSGAAAVAGPPSGGGRRPAPGTPPPAPRPSTLVGHVVFVRAMGQTNNIMALRPDGSVVSLQVSGWHPHVSPDGKKVAFATPTEGIGVLDLTAGTVTQIAPRLSVRPRWSPDGTKILFRSDRGGTKELYTMNPDGSGVTQLSDGTGRHHEGDWSPDGLRVVFRRAVDDGGDIWTMNANGTGAALLYKGDRMDSDPRWSPDGKHIAFVRMVLRSQSSGATSEIFVMNADGTNVRRLTFHDGEDWAPAWSPDGSLIAFFGFRTGPNDPDVFTIRPDGSELSVLLGGENYDHGPDYGPAN